MNYITVSANTHQIAVPLDACGCSSGNIGSLELKLSRTGKEDAQTFVYGPFAVSDSGKVLFYIDDTFKAQPAGWYTASVFRGTVNCGHFLVKLGEKSCSIGKVEAIDGTACTTLNPAPECPGAC